MTPDQRAARALTPEQRKFINKRLQNRAGGYRAVQALKRLAKRKTQTPQANSGRE